SDLRHETVCHEAGADEVIVGDDLAPAHAYGPYHLIIDLFGGKTLESAISLLATGGTCVIVGASASPSATIDFGDLMRTERVTLYALNMYAEFDSLPRSEVLYS